jgi:hypothetical protein
MIDLILLVFVIAVFCAGFWAGGKFGTATKAWEAITEWFREAP